MTEPLKLAFLGVDNPHGSGWRDLLLHFSDSVRITALVPGLDGGLTSLEERLADVPRFPTVDDLIGRGDFDAALVCLPNDAGPPAMLRLAEAGKHVLVEKPAAGNADDLQPLVDVFERSGLAFQNGYMWRYDEAANRLRQMLADGRFGKLISVEMKYLTSDVRRRDPRHYLFDPAVSGGGFFNWLGCHYLDLLRYITARTIVGVTARCGVFGDTPCSVEDGGVAILDLEGGAVATLIGGYWLPRWAGEHEWTIRGSSRWVRWDPTRVGSSGVLEIHGPQPQWYATEETFVVPADHTPGYGGQRGVRLVEDWLTTIRHGRGACRNTVRSTVRTLELVDTIYRASREGQRIACHIPADP